MIRSSLLVSFCLLLLAPAAASAHATLERTEPTRGADVAASPEVVAFFFNEPIEASFGAVRLFDARGEEVDTGELVRPDGSSDAIGVEPSADLADGTYTATYRVTSADSHPVSGGFVFAVGNPGEGSAQTVGELLDEGDAGAATDAAFAVDRFAGYAAIGVAIGSLVFLLFAFGPASGGLGDRKPWSRRITRLLATAVGVGLLASLLAIPLQGSTAGGIGFIDALDPARLGDVLETRFGEMMLVRIAAWVALGAVLWTAARRDVLSTGRAPAWLAALLAAPLLALAVTPALSGHARTQDPTILVPSDVVHVAAMGVWLGGIAVALFVLPAATRVAAAGERTGFLVGVLKRFSALALAAVIALAASGTIQAVVEVGSFPALVDTGFGRMVLAKIALFAVLVGLGWANRERVIPALAALADKGSRPGAVGLALRRNLRLELGLIAAVLAVTAVLVSYAPPDARTTGPASGRTEAGDLVVEYTADPGQVGRNQLHLYLFDSSDGAQFDGARQVEAQITQEEKGIGPLDVELRRAGPGHYVAPSAPFGAPGDWTLTVEVRTSRFDQTQAEFDVPIR